MLQLAYVSSTQVPFSPDEIAEILIKSRERNASRGITGLLLYRGGNILQILEGEADSVRRLYATIAGDPRHHGVIKLFEKEITERDFADWSMGFCDVDAEGAKYLEGFSEVLDPGFDLQALKPSQATKLIKVFKAAIR